MTDNSPGTPGDRSSESGSGRPRFTTTVLAVVVAVCVTAMVLAIGVALVLGSSPGSSSSTSADSTTTHSASELDSGLSVPATTQIGTQTPPPPPVEEPPESPESALLPPPPPEEEGDPSSPSSPVPPEPPMPENKEAKPPPPPPEFAVGECVELSGTEEQPVAPTSCGGQDSSYAVSGKTEPGGTCPTDVDRTQPTESATLCLDIDWTVDSCMQLDGPDPQRVDCSASEGVRVVEILRDTTDTGECASADQAFVYDQRQYVVCIAKL